MCEIVEYLFENAKWKYNIVIYYCILERNVLDARNHGSAARSAALAVSEEQEQ